MAHIHHIFDQKCTHSTLNSESFSLKSDAHWLLMPKAIKHYPLMIWKIVP